MEDRKIHILKILPKYFDAVAHDVKTFEIRRNDRGYRVGDILVLQEFENGEYTGQVLIRRVCYMVDNPAYCKEGFVVLGLSRE